MPMTRNCIKNKVLALVAWCAKSKYARLHPGEDKHVHMFSESPHPVTQFISIQFKEQRC